MDVPQSSPPFRRLPACATAACALAATLVGQTPVRLVQETALLKEPGGTRLVSLVSGLRLTPGRRSGGFMEVTVSGWIFTASTQPDRREGFALSVKADGGENLRSAPDGPVLGRAAEGALFHRVAARGGWTQVRRAGWIAAAALTTTNRSGATPAQNPAPPPAPAPAAPAPAPTPQPVAPAARDSDTAVRRGILKPGIQISRTPEGDAVASLLTSGVVTLHEHDRGWVKVRLEGWVRQGEIDGAVAPLPAITAAMLRQNPDRYVGQTVDWRLQFLSRQRADELRPEMPLGHDYLLTRGPLPETGFVYVMVSKAQADELAGLKPLDELSVRATVRTARTRYLATPIVELVRIVK